MSTTYPILDAHNGHFLLPEFVLPMQASVSSSDANTINHSKTSTKTPAFGKGIIRIGLKYSQWALFHQGHHFTVRLVTAITLQPLPEFKRLTEILRLLQRCNGLLLSRHRGGKIP